nr:MAG TPA: hypothetical protein [Caudoviricetes sp.]
MTKSKGLARKPCKECGRPYGLEDPIECRTCGARLCKRYRDAHRYATVTKPKIEADRERNKLDAMGRLRVERSKYNLGTPEAVALMHEEYLENHQRELEEKRAALAARRAAEDAKPRVKVRESVSIYAPLNLGEGVEGETGNVVQDEGLLYYLRGRRARLARLAGGSGAGAGRRAGVKGKFVPAPVAGR